MRVLLVQSLSTEGISSEMVYPLGIVSLATHLESQGYEVKVLDLNLTTNPYSLLYETLQNVAPDVVGVSLRNIDPLGNKTTSLIPPFMTIVRLIRKTAPSCCIVAGGTGYSLFPTQIMQLLPEITYGMVGEAEKSFPQLLASLDNPPPLPGLCQRVGTEIQIQSPSRAFDLQSHYTIPDRQNLTPKPYLSVNSYVPAVGIETKRGCPYHCSYCVYPLLQGRELRCRVPKEVVDEIEELHKAYGIHRFHFNDPVVNMDNGHLEAICEEILRRGLMVQWGGFFREDTLQAKNVNLFAKSGCECFSFSPDGLGQEALDILKKQLNEEDIIRAATLVSKTEVLSMYHFMVNVPGETEKTARKGVRFLERLYEIHGPRKNLGTIVFNNIRIMPNTPIAYMAKRQGLIDEHTNLLYPTYYNPQPFSYLRYHLETIHLYKNVCMWQGVEA